MIEKAREALEADLNITEHAQARLQLTNITNKMEPKNEAEDVFTEIKKYLYIKKGIKLYYMN